MRARAFPLLTRRNIACCLLAALWGLLNVTAGAYQTAAAASAATVTPQTAATQAVVSQPDAASVADAYLALRLWVRQFDPPGMREEAARLPLPGAGGVSIALRWRGRILGAGVDMTGDDLAVRRAAGRAMAAVLADRTVTALPDDLGARIGEALTIELEVAGRLEPLAGRTFAEIAEQIEPGLDGVALRRGESMAVRFPGRMLAANTAGAVERILPALAVELDLPARPLAALRAAHGVRAYRFRTIHLAQRAPGRRPMQLFRGQRLISRREITTDRLEALGEALADHLLASLYGGDEPLGLMGDYLPAIDEYRPPFAPPRDQALAAFALARFAATPGQDPGPATRLRQAARVILEELAQVHEGEAVATDDLLACAAIVYAGGELGIVGGAREKASTGAGALVARALERVVAVAEAHAAQRGETPSDSIAPLGPHGQAVLAGALARSLRGDAGNEMLQAATGVAIDAAWAAVPAHEHATLLPWIGWAEQDRARAEGRDMANLHLLRALAHQMEASRIGSPGPINGPDDLHGGFVLRPGRRPSPDAQSIRPAIWLAAALRDPLLTPPDELEKALAGQLASMRFLAQLAIGDEMLWAMRSPQRARGGLRAATWDSRQPVAAQAMGLLAVAETLISLEAAGSRPGGHPGGLEGPEGPEGQ